MPKAGLTQSWIAAEATLPPGWWLRDLARQDPEYLRWLSRHSSGAPLREAIKTLLYAADHRPR